MIAKQKNSQRELITGYKTRLKLALHYLTPQFYLTRLAGWFADKKWGKVTHFVINQFSKKYNIDMSEAAKSEASDYESFNQFFTRPLKEGVRPISDAPVVMPADGRISQFGDIRQGRMLQAKGHDFSLADLLAEDEQLVPLFENGLYQITYLSPRDYHRVHMPCDGVLRKMIYVPGDLFSVNPFLAKHIPNLFARNERVICYFDTPLGAMVQILVGATITASVKTTWHGIVNPPRGEKIKEWSYLVEGNEAVKFTKGDEMGAFCLGSTVINLFQQDACEFFANLEEGMAVKMGEALAQTHNSDTQNTTNG